MKNFNAAQEPQNHRRATANGPRRRPTEAELQQIKRTIRTQRTKRKIKHLEGAAEHILEHFAAIAPVAIKAAAKIAAAAVIPATAAAAVIGTGYGLYQAATAAIAWIRNQDWILPSLGIVLISGLAAAAVQFMKSGLRDNRNRTVRHGQPGHGTDSHHGQTAHQSGGGGQTIIIYQNQNRTQ